MGCNCASKSIFSGGKGRLKKSSHKSQKKRSRKGTRKLGKRMRKRMMKGGISLLGDNQTGLMEMTNKLTGSIFVPPEHYLQPASNNYGNGNSYLV